MNSSLERFPESPENHVSRVWQRPLPDRLDEPADRENYLPYEPTPILNREVNVHYDSIVGHQQEVAETTDPLFSEYAPDDIPMNIRSMIELDHIVGRMHRETKNIHAWYDWEERNDILSGELEPIKERVLTGQATPYESLLLLSQTNLRSVELTKVTHPYGYRMEYVADARQSIEEAFYYLSDRGVLSIYRPDMSYRKISIEPNISISGGELDPRRINIDGLEVVTGSNDVVSVSGLNGFLVTYKRDIGSINRHDGRRIKVVERQSAAFRLDNGVKDLNQKIINKIIESAEDRNYAEGWIDESGARGLIEQSIQNNVDADYLVPLSTMTYATLESEEERDRRLAERPRYTNIGGLALFGTIQESQSDAIYPDESDQDADSQK